MQSMKRTRVGNSACRLALAVGMLAGISAAAEPRAPERGNASEHQRPQISERERVLREALAMLESEPIDAANRQGELLQERVGFRQPPSRIAEIGSHTLSVRRVIAKGEEQLVTSERITRSHDTVAIKAEGSKSSWTLFANPVDPSRAMGYLVDYERRLILEHDESDLRTFRVARDWLDAYTLGFSPDSLERYELSGETEALGGHSFAHYWREHEGVRTDVWWSQELLMPLRITVSSSDTSWTQEITAIEATTEQDPALVLPPKQRIGRLFQTMMIGDWYENHMGCGCIPGGMPAPGRGPGSAGA